MLYSSICAWCVVRESFSRIITSVGLHMLVLCIVFYAEQCGKHTLCVIHIVFALCILGLPCVCTAFHQLQYITLRWQVQKLASFIGDTRIQDTYANYSMYFQTCCTLYWVDLTTDQVCDIRVTVVNDNFGFWVVYYVNTLVN